MKTSKDPTVFHILILTSIVSLLSTIDDSLDDVNLGDLMLERWMLQKSKLEHDFAVTAWVLCVMKEVRDDVKERMNGKHCKAIERVILKLYFKDEVGINERLNQFWKEFKHWQNRTGKYAHNEEPW